MGKDRSNRASSADEGNGGGGEVKGLPQLSQTLQESERFLSQAGRPGGTLKVPLQTSADYVPQDEDAVQQSKEALGKDLKNEVSSSAEDVNEAKEPVVDEKVESQTNKYSISANPTEIVKRIRTLQKKIQIIMRKSGFNKKHQAIVDALFREMKFLELQKKKLKLQSKSLIKSLAFSFLSCDSARLENLDTSTFTTAAGRGGGCWDLETRQE